MKNSYVIGFVLILVLVVGLFLSMKKEKLEAPVVPDQALGGEENSMPVPVADDAPVPVETEVIIDTSSAAVKEFTVTGKNFSFSPNKITVKKGDSVKITFENSQGFHDFKIDEYGLATKQGNAPATEVLEFTADKAGSFEYYCSVGSHRSNGMQGVLVVE